MKTLFLLCFMIIVIILSSSVILNAQVTKRFFSNQSFWNQPIPENAEIDPRTDKWIEMLKQEPTKEYFGINWTVPG